MGSSLCGIEKVKSTIELTLRTSDGMFFLKTRFFLQKKKKNRGSKKKTTKTCFFKYHLICLFLIY